MVITTEKSALSIALGILARRDHSLYELTQKLEQKSIPDDAIQAVLATCKARKYLDDQRFAENYVQYRARSGFGPQRIVAELQQKGVAEADYRDFVYAQEMAWPSRAREVWEKKFKTAATDRQTQGKQVRFMQQRGFLMSHIGFILGDD